MKPTMKFVLLATVMLSAQPLLANDAEQARPDYYNSKRTSHGERTVAAPRIDMDERMAMHGEHHGEMHGHHRMIAKDIANGSDNDGNNRSRHSFIFPKGSSQVVKH